MTGHEYTVVVCRDACIALTLRSKGQSGRLSVSEWVCMSIRLHVWSVVIFCGSGLLLLFGAFLAFETRKVTVAALNDSKFIG